MIAPLNQIQFGCLVDSHAAIVDGKIAVDAAGMRTDELYPTILVW